MKSSVWTLLCLCGFILLSSSLAVAKKKHKHEKPLACPTGISNFEGESKAFKTYKINKTDRILICVPADAMEDGKLKNKFLYQYEAALFRKSKFIRRVFSGSQKTPVIFEKKKDELYEIMHLNFRDAFYPLYSEKIVCKKNECKREEKTCVFDQNQLSPLSPKEIEREKIIYGKGAAQVQEMTDADLSQMANLALHGRKLAFGFFTDMSTRPIMMGTANEFYQHMQALLSEMKSEGCLKLPEL
jgi:hypothetical protein